MKPYHYHISETFTEAPSNINFRLHNHDDYEILFFFEGDARYVVEERTYSLEPCDIIIIRKHEMHRIYHNSPARYRRSVLMVSPEFFRANNCPEYEAQFLNASSDIGNKLSGDVVRSSGLYDAFLRYKKYSNNFTVDGGTPILRSIMTEILYLLNQSTMFSSSDLAGSPIKPVISYLNNHYTEEITLDGLEEQFYLSKYYLCRTFRRDTGLTIHEYLNRKRLTRVGELKKEGKSIGEAAQLAGFRDYSSFYRAYMKENGMSPGKGLV